MKYQILMSLLLVLLTSAIVWELPWIRYRMLGCTCPVQKNNCGCWEIEERWGYNVHCVGHSPYPSFISPTIADRLFPGPLVAPGGLLRWDMAQ